MAANTFTTLRVPPAQAPQPRGQFKAIVVISMPGGLDSYNVLVPHSGCGEVDLYAKYARVRTNLAIARDQLLPIDAATGTQPCDRFGVHPNMPFLRSLYEEGQASFLANTGPLVEPIANRRQIDRRPRTARVPVNIL
jgi:cullin-associated NEDD8-dissociated protein 1